MLEIITLTFIGILTVLVIVLLAAVIKLSKKQENEAQNTQKLSELNSTINSLLLSNEKISSANEKAIGLMSEKLNQRVENMEKTVKLSQDRASLTNEKTITLMSENLNQRVENMEKTVSILTKSVKEDLDKIGKDNEKKLEQIQATVDEKLQKTLEERISRSFGDVSTRLEQVHKSLGEINTLTKDVSDLTRALNNVKTRGISGEISLGAILEEILSPEQYEKNVVTVPGSNCPVEFAIKLPGNGDACVYLPIDSKFPLDCYRALEDAQLEGDREKISKAAKEFEQRIKLFAATIREKYIRVPDTTDFALMFLPTESIYATAVQMGVAEAVRAKYKVTVCGPTTTAALLNSLQMGFQTLAISKRSNEVWEVLGAVKSEFEKFEEVLTKTQNRIDSANKELDKLVGERTRQIRRKLKNVEAIDRSDLIEGE